LGGFNCGNRVKAEAAVKGFYFILMEAKAAKTFVAFEAKIHFFACELSIAAALVVHEGGFVGC
jgi:hypothetical protein